MKAISFLGTTAYKPTTYEHRGARCHTRFFAEALIHFYPELEEVLVFATPTVRQHANLAALRERLGTRMRAVPIPEGHSEEELWQIFDALIEAVDEGETVLFDITNSYRSLPLLVLLAAAYLRTARGVNLEGVIYGAFEARTGSDLPGEAITPVFDLTPFDLTPFLELLDWLTATDQFIRTGNARYLAGFLDEQGRRHRSNALKYAARKLSELSQAMMMCRPLEVMETAEGLGQALQRAAEHMALWTKPFTLLADRINAEYADRGCANYWQDVHRGLRIQLDLIQWYLDNEQIIQAVTLAREWMITLVGYRLSMGLSLDADRREAQIGYAIGQLSRQHRGEEVDLCEAAIALSRLPECEQIRETWDSLSNMRNDLDHAGMRESGARAARLVRRAKSLLPDLETLFHNIPSSPKDTR